MSSQHPHYAYDHLKADPNVSAAFRAALPSLNPSATPAQHEKAAARLASDVADVAANRLALDFVRRLAMTVTASIDPENPFRCGPFIDELAAIIAERDRLRAALRRLAGDVESVLQTGIGAMPCADEADGFYYTIGGNSVKRLQESLKTNGGAA